jgi:hypothetical protein
MWTGAPKPITGRIEIDGKIKRFMGEEGADEIMEQVSVELSLTATKYTFGDDKIRLTLKFITPFLLDDPKIAFRPLSYITLRAESLDGKEHRIKIRLAFSEKAVYDEGKKLTWAGTLPYPDLKIGYIGRLIQKSLTTAGDKKEIDWGWLYLAGDSDIFVARDSARGIKSKANGARKYKKALVSEKSGAALPGRALEYALTVAYDDIHSINYFGSYKKGYWTTAYFDIVDCLREDAARREEIIARAEALDEETEERITREFGKKLLCSSGGRLPADDSVFQGRGRRRRATLYFEKYLRGRGAGRPRSLVFRLAAVFDKSARARKRDAGARF